MHDVTHLFKDIFDYIFVPLAALVGWKIKVDSDFKKDIKREQQTLHKRISEHEKHVLENHPSNKDIDRVIDSMNRGFSEVKQEIRDIRKK